jgi:hypothetical protein
MNIDYNNLFTIVGGIISLGITSFFTINASKKSVYKIFSERFAAFEDGLTRLEGLFVKHTKKETFISDLPEMIRVNSRTLIDNDSDMEQHFKDALIFWFNFIQDYASYYYQSSLRKSDDYGKLRLKKYLEMEMISGMSEFLRYLLRNVYAKKQFTVGSRTIETNFHDYLKGTKQINPSVFHRNEKLVIRLVENGLDENKLKDVMSVYVEEFIELFKGVLKEWRKMEEFKLKERTV